MSSQAVHFRGGSELPEEELEELEGPAFVEVDATERYGRVSSGMAGQTRRIGLVWFVEGGL